MGYCEVLWRRAVQEQRWTSGGIHRQERLELLQAVKQGCEALPHRLQGIIIKQRPHALPPQPLAAAFCPDGSEPRTAPLWRLVDHRRQPHHQGTPHGELLLAMAVGVLTVVALIFQGIARLIFNLPPRTSTSHQAIHSALAHPQVCYPAQVLGLPIAYSQYAIKLTRTSAFEALSGTSLTKRNRCTTPAARSWRSYYVTRPACSAACPWGKRWA